MRQIEFPLPELLELEPHTVVGWAEVHGMDMWLDNLETLATAMHQRRMTSDQRERLYGLLERMYTDARRRRADGRRSVRVAS